MNVCLATVHTRPAFIPLALLYLKAVLVEHRGLPRQDVSVLEFPPDAQADIVLERILSTSPDIVGLSCYVWNITLLMEVARRLKAERPGVPIVIGGPEVGPLGREVLSRYPAIDVVVRSEGEVPFGEIIERLAAMGAGFRGPLPLDDVPGIVFRRDSVIVETGEAPILRDLDVLPSPHLGGYVDASRARIVCIETQRGCVFRCNFCFYNKDLSIRNRRFDLERVKQEILFWLDRDVLEIYLMDPVFNLNAARTKELCAFIAAHNTKRVAFHAEIWAEFVDEEMARLFKAANITFLEVGLQSTDDSALATVERRLKLHKFLDGIDNLKRQQLPFELQLIFGLPGETRESFRTSLNFAARLEPTWLSVFPLMVLPGTELWHKAGPLKLEFDPAPPYVIRSHLSMTRDDVAYGLRVSDAMLRLDRSRAIQVFSREPGVTMADLVDDWLHWQEAQADAESDDALATFVEHVCAKRGVPPEFYRAMASIELSSAPSAAG
jgi:radical SAM superfamily enzyme YgiQ (UPF0313 family)